MIRWIARIILSVLLLSLGYGCLVRAADNARSSNWAGSLQPVYSAEAKRAGYTYHESESLLGRAEMVRRRTGTEPVAMDICLRRPMTAEEFYAGRVRETLDERLQAAMAEGLDTASVSQIGWPWPVWEREFRFRWNGPHPESSRGHVSFGPLGIMTRPVWPSFPLWVLAVACLLWAMEYAGRSILRAMFRLRTPYGHCASCRYDMAGIDATVCPECGMKQPLSQPVA